MIVFVMALTDPPGKSIVLVGTFSEGTTSTPL